MPYSVIIDMYSNTEITKDSLKERIFYAVILNIIQSSDPELSKFFHDEEFNKAMTLRMLNYKNNLLSLRLTLLDEKLFERFANTMLNACMQSYDLNGTKLNITKISSTKQSDRFWADYLTYKEIYDNASKTEKNLSFSIVTPMSFRNGDSFNAFPTPNLFFKSLHKKWNKHSGLPFDDIFLDFLERDIFVSSYNLRTQQVKDNQKIAFTGCVGDITFKVSGKASERFIHYLNVLSNFAYFAGVGAKTTMGMGQLYRALQPSISSKAEKKEAVTNEI